ncbi:hypothetical protein FRC18_012326 [Serendipita sp. 400]|nr:hypothetical protein FRC18_012326 [Serendipita sp. 400]
MSKLSPIHRPKADPTAGGFEFSKKPKANAALRLKSTLGVSKKVRNHSESPIGITEGGNETIKSPKEKDTHRDKKRGESYEQESPNTDEVDTTSQLHSQEPSLAATFSNEQMVESPAVARSVQNSLEENNPVDPTSGTQNTNEQDTSSLAVSPLPVPPVDEPDPPVTPFASDESNVVTDINEPLPDFLTSGSTSPPMHRDADAEASTRETATNGSSPTDTRLSPAFQSPLDLKSNVNLEGFSQELASNPSEATINGDLQSLLIFVESKDEPLYEEDDESLPLCANQEAVPEHSVLYHVSHVMPPSVSPFSSSRCVMMNEISGEANGLKRTIQESDDAGVPLLLVSMPPENLDASSILCLSSCLPEEGLEPPRTTWLGDNTTSSFRLSASGTSFFAQAVDTSAVGSLLRWRVIPRGQSEQFLDLCCKNAPVGTIKNVEVSEDYLNIMLEKEITVYECVQHQGQTVCIPAGCWYQTVAMNGTMKLNIIHAYTLATTFNAFHREIYARHRSCTPDTPPYRRMLYGYLRLVLRDIEESHNFELINDDWVHGNLVYYRPSQVLDAIRLFDRILVEEYTQGDREHEAHLNKPGFCDFCGTDIFHAAFACSTQWDTSTSSDPLTTCCEVKLCPTCCAEGRACLCGNIRLCSVFDFEELLSIRNRIVSWCQKVISPFPPSIKSWLTDEDVYEATDYIHLTLGAIAIHNMRRSTPGLDKNLVKEPKFVICSGGSSCCDEHEILRIHGITCDTCNESICFPHILASGIHAAEAAYRWEEDRDWHYAHHKWAPKWAEWTKVSTNTSKHPADGIITLAKTLSSCRPIKADVLRLGFYDQPAESVECARYEDYVNMNDAPTPDPDATQISIAPVSGITKGYKRKPDVLVTDNPNIHAPKRRRKNKDPAFSLKRGGKGKKPTKGRKQMAHSVLIEPIPGEDTNVTRKRAFSANSSTTMDPDAGSEAPDDLLHLPTSSPAQSEVESDEEANVAHARTSEAFETPVSPGSLVETETFGRMDLDLKKIDASLHSFGRARPSLDTDAVITGEIPPPLTGDSAALSGLTTGATSPMTPGDHLYTYRHSSEDQNPSPTSAQRKRLAGLSLEDYKSKWEFEVESNRLLQLANIELKKENGFLQREVSEGRHFRAQLEERTRIQEDDQQVNLSAFINAEKQNMLQELDGLRQMTVQLEATVTRLQALSVHNEQIEEENRQLQSMLETSNNSQARLQSELETLRRRALGMQREIDELQPIKQNFFQMQSQLQELNSVKLRNQNLEAEVTALRPVQARSQGLQDQMDKLRRELESERNNRRKAERDNEELRLNISRMISTEGRSFALEQQLAEITKEKSRMQMELEKHQKILDQKNLELIRYSRSGKSVPRKGSSSGGTQASRERSRSYSQTPSKRTSSKHDTSSEDTDGDGEPDPIDLLGGRYGR